MFIYLSKLLPLFLYPLGIATIMLLVALFTTRARLKRWALIIALLAVFLGGNRWVARALVWPLERYHEPLTTLPEADVIVLLGGGSQGADAPRPIAELNSAGERMLYAAYLYQQGVAPTILATGGGIKWLGAIDESEANAMSEILGIMDVPTAALWLETESLNTHENAVFSGEILREQGIDEIVLVTSAFHMPRSVAIFEKQGFTVIPAPVDYRAVDNDLALLRTTNIGAQFINLLPSGDNMDLTYTALKEYLGIAVYWVTGRL